MRRLSTSLLLLLALMAQPARAEEPAADVETRVAAFRAWQVEQLRPLFDQAVSKTDVVFAGRLLRDLRVASGEDLDELAAWIEALEEDVKKSGKTRAALVKKHRAYRKTAAKRLIDIAKAADEDTTATLAREAVALDRTNSSARKLLGLVKVKDWGWVTEEDAAKFKQGLLPVGGEWLDRQTARSKAKAFEHAWVVTTDHWRIRSNLELKRIFELRELLEAHYAKFLDDWDGFTPMRDVKEPFDVWICATKEDYEHATKNDPGRITGVPGQYSPSLGRSAFYDVEQLAGGGNRVSSMAELMLHECTHQLMHEQLASRFVFFESAAAPNFWLHEGICEYYAMHTLKKDELVIDKKAVKSMVRTAHLKKKPAGLLTVADMDTVVKSHYLGTDMNVRATRYAQSGFFCAYLVDKHRVGFRQLLRTAYCDENRSGLITELVGDPADIQRGFNSFMAGYGIR